MHGSNTATPGREEGSIPDEEAEGCTWQTGGSYPDTPPERCDNDVEPGEEYCSVHKEKAEAVERWEAEVGLS